MKRVSLAVLVFLLAASPAMSQVAPKFGVGGYGGVSIPVLQDDQGNGSSLGFKIRYRLASVLVVEPNLNFDTWGSPDPVEGIDLGIDGSKVTSYGVDLVLGNAPGSMGISPYFVGGVASYKIENDDTNYDESNVGWSAGLGLGIGLTPKFGLDFRGKFLVAPQDQGSKKGLSIVGGLNVNFGGR